MSHPARFLSRWSRLKQQAAEAPMAPVAAAGTPAAVPDAVAPEAVLPLDAGSDLTALLREELSDALRKQTLKAIFADPHFNVMDGLDTYIDDYSISEPIPPEMLAALNQARFLFGADEATAAEVPATVEPNVSINQVGGAEIVCDNLDQSEQKVSVPASLEIDSEEK